MNYFLSGGAWGARAALVGKGRLRNTRFASGVSGNFVASRAVGAWTFGVQAWRVLLMP